MKATTFSSLAVLAFQALQVSAGSSVCSSGIYAAFAPLDTYAPAVSYCQGQAGKTTVTVTVSAKAKRHPATAATPKSIVTTTTLKTSTNKTTADAKAASWSSLVASQVNDCYILLMRRLPSHRYCTSLSMARILDR